MLNPCHRLESSLPVCHAPSILTVEETQKAMDWLRVHPKWLAWFALSAFAGLRPEEAAGSEWKAINFTEGSVTVEAQTSKMRQRRVVYPLPMCMAWLKEAKRLKSTLPLTVKARTIGLRLLTVVLGWPEWKSDVTRHSAASYWLAQCGSAATVATALGHSESILRKNYMALVRIPGAVGQ